MRRIEKGAAPDCLGELENTPGANWNSVHGDQKQQLRDALYEAQLGLCAYCMSRLPGTNENDMTIEHFASRAVSPENTFQWPNLLGVCMGDIGIQGDGANRDRYHCDNFRGKIATTCGQEIFVNPARFPPDASSLFAYTPSGDVRPARTLKRSQRDRVELTIERLNLRIRRLKRNRAAIMQQLRKQLQELEHRQRFTEARLRNLLRIASTPNADSQMQPYSQVAVAYLQKKIAQLP